MDEVLSWSPTDLQLSACTERDNCLGKDLFSSGINLQLAVMSFVFGFRMFRPAETKERVMQTLDGRSRLGFSSRYSRRELKCMLWALGNLLCKWPPSETWASFRGFGWGWRLSHMYSVNICAKTFCHVLRRCVPPGRVPLSLYNINRLADHRRMQLLVAVHSWRTTCRFFFNN